VVVGSNPSIRGSSARAVRGRRGVTILFPRRASSADPSIWDAPTATCSGVELIPIQPRSRHPRSRDFPRRLRGEVLCWPPRALIGHACAFSLMGGMPASAVLVAWLVLCRRATSASPGTGTFGVPQGRVETPRSATADGLAPAAPRPGRPVSARWRTRRLFGRLPLCISLVISNLLKCSPL